MSQLKVKLNDGVLSEEEQLKVIFPKGTRWKLIDIKVDWVKMGVEVDLSIEGLKDKVDSSVKMFVESIGKYIPPYNFIPLVNGGVCMGGRIWIPTKDGDTFKELSYKMVEGRSYGDFMKFLDSGITTTLLQDVMGLKIQHHEVEFITEKEDIDHLLSFDTSVKSFLELETIKDSLIQNEEVV